MTTRDIHLAVSQATGETIASIARRGFTIDVHPPPRPDYDDDPEAYYVDWDAAEATRQSTCGVDPFPPRRRLSAS